MSPGERRPWESTGRDPGTRGLFLAVEGLDGSGKSTQSTLVASALEARGLRSRLVHFPQYDEPIYGRMVARFLRGEFGPVNHVDPWIVAILFAGNRAANAESLWGRLNTHDALVVDRYILSNIAFQGAKITDRSERAAFRAWAWELETVLHGIPVPDLSVFVDVPIAVIARRLGGPRSNEDRAYLRAQKDIHEMDLALQTRVRGEYLELAEERSDLAIIDGGAGDQAAPAEVVCQRIVVELERRGMVLSPTT